MGVNTKLDLNRFHWKFILMIQNVYAEQRNRWRQSKEWIRCILEQKIVSSLLPSRQPSSSVFVGKVSAMLEVVVKKNNDKPLEQFLSSHDREVILLIITAAQLNLAEFCLSYKREKKRSLNSPYLANKKILQDKAIFNFLCSFVTRNFKNIFIVLGSE